MLRRVLTVLALLLMTAAAVVAALRQRMEADVRGLLARATEAETQVSYSAVRSIQFGDRAMRLRVVHQAPDRTQIEPVDGWRGRGERGPRGERDDRGPRDERDDRGQRGEREESGARGERDDHGPRGERHHGRHGGERGRGRRDGGGGDWRAIPIVHVDLALRNYDATAEGASVRFTPRYAGRPTLSMTFDEATGLLTGWEASTPGGTARLSTESLDVAAAAGQPASATEAAPQRREWDREGRGGGTFDPERDPGPKGFDLILPRALPRGFQLHEARLMQRGEWESVRIVWTDGIALVCLTEFDAVATGNRWGGTELPRPEAGKVVVERRCHEGTSLLRGRVGDTGFVVIGSIEEAELTGLISSLETRPVVEEGVR